jgi:uncharacterized YccA/Bax inhibitor family protein
MIPAQELRAMTGIWMGILFEYDTKTRRITHNFSDGIVAEG